MNQKIAILRPLPHPWTPAQATDRLRVMARDDLFELSYKYHARDQLRERGLIMSDALYVLKNGFVYNNPEESTRNGYYKYKIECRTPNSGQRNLAIIVIPEIKYCGAKIVTIMWADEPTIKG